MDLARLGDSNLLFRFCMIDSPYLTKVIILRIKRKGNNKSLSSSTIIQQSCPVEQKWFPSAIERKKTQLRPLLENYGYKNVPQFQMFFSENNVKLYVGAPFPRGLVPLSIENPGSTDDSHTEFWMTYQLDVADVLRKLT